MAGSSTSTSDAAATTSPSSSSSSFADSGFTNTQIGLIVASPFILTTLIVVLVILIKRRRAHNLLKKRPDVFFEARDDPVQMVDNTVRKPETATVEDKGTNWQETPLHGHAILGMKKNPWAS